MKQIIIFLSLLSICIGLSAQQQQTNIVRKNYARVVLDSSEHARSCLDITLFRDSVQTVSKRILMPPYVCVKDIVCENDSVFFCGYTFFKDNWEGFIAYASLEEIMSENCIYHYSSPKSVYVVDKLCTYYNNNGLRIIAAVGKQDYCQIIVAPTKIDTTIVKAEKGYVFGENKDKLWAIASPKRQHCFITYIMTDNSKTNNPYNTYDMCYLNNQQIEDFRQTKDSLIFLVKEDMSLGFDHKIVKLTKSNLDSCDSYLAVKYKDSANVAENEYKEYMPFPFNPWRHCIFATKTTFTRMPLRIKVFTTMKEETKTISKARK